MRNSGGKNIKFLLAQMVTKIPWDLNLFNDVGIAYDHLLLSFRIKMPSLLDLISALVQINNFYTDGSDTSGEIDVKIL